MNARKREKQRLGDFEAFCAAVGQETPTTDVVLKNRETGEVEVSNTNHAGWNNITLTQHDSKTGEALAEQPPEMGRRVVTTDSNLAEIFGTATEQTPTTQPVQNSTQTNNDVTQAALVTEPMNDGNLESLVQSADASQDRLMRAKMGREVANA
jgi:hypothetical protein